MQLQFNNYEGAPQAQGYLFPITQSMHRCYYLNVTNNRQLII
jgi:hypothetical protein